MKAELHRLKKELKDNDQFADKQPPYGADWQPPRKGKKGQESP